MANAIVSSLAVHHLEGSEKAELFRAMYDLLIPGGTFLIADIVQPTTKEGITYAAQQWDMAVQEQSKKLDDSLKTYEYFVAERWNYFLHPDPGDKPSTLLDQLFWLQEAGFVKADVYWMKAGHAIFGARKPV